MLDPAVPPTRPDANDRLRLIALGALGSLAFALGLAILLDRFDRRFRYPGPGGEGTRPVDSRRGAADPASWEAGAEPGGSGERGRGVPHHPDERDPHPWLREGTGDDHHLEPGPGDGKSLVSANLALSFAESGYKVVLVDGDIRRGELHRSFGVDRKPGLLDCLSGTASIEQVLRSGATRT